jgi:hypothetical protein
VFFQYSINYNVIFKIFNKLKVNNNFKFDNNFKNYITIKKALKKILVKNLSQTYKR